jgi:hypothetical protein
MQKKGWVTVAETSPTGRAMSVTITRTGVTAFTRASTAWRTAQATAVGILGADAISVLDQWLGLDPEIATGSDAATETATAGSKSGC